MRKMLSVTVNDRTVKLRMCGMFFDLRADRFTQKLNRIISQEASERPLDKLFVKYSPCPEPGTCGFKAIEERCGNIAKEIVGSYCLQRQEGFSEWDEFLMIKRACDDIVR